MNTPHPPGDLAAARDAWLAAGALPLPAATDGSKRPGVKAWRNLQNPTNRPSSNELDRLWHTNTDGIGIICGAASGGIEMLELEGAAVAEGWMTRLQQAFTSHASHTQGDPSSGDSLWQRLIGGYMELTPTGGIHWYYRVNGQALGNTKLASRPTTPQEREQHPGQKTRVMIETRGEGGWSITAPSGGRTHPTGAAWTVMPGRTPDQIITFTAKERDTIHAICRTLDETPTPTAQQATPPPAPQPSQGLRPGDDYNNRATWADILQPHGWTIDHQAGGTTYWIRPGKRRGEGISATTGHSSDGQDRLWVFSTSTDFQPETPYSKLGAYALLEHGGDHSAAATTLHAQGWGDQTPHQPVLTLVRDTSHDGTSSELPLAAGAEHLAPVLNITEHRNTHTITVGGLTDQANAELLAAEHAHHLRYEPARAQWLSWDGCKWGWCDDDGEAIQHAIATIQRIEQNSKDVTKHVNRSLSRAGLEACVALARRHQAMRVANSALDANPHDLNTPDGIVNLKDGSTRPATPGDWCTRSTTTTPADGTPHRWLTFLADTFEDPELVAYVQRLAGYSAIGEVTHHILPFLHGSGGNGKSVFMEVITGLLGDYASTAPPNFLMAGREDESAIARLHGLRLVASSEVGQSARFDEAKVKLLTGGDRITARFLYGRHFTFSPSATLWLMGNHQPRVEAGGESFWRRLRLVPFTRTVPPEKRIEGLAQQLIKQEGPQILHWIVQGAVDVVRDGMRTPESVTAATSAYASEEDALGRFVADRLHLSTSKAARESTAKVRAAYIEWCRDEGEMPLSSQAFGRELRTRFGVKSLRSHGARFYVGVTLLADPDDDPESDDREWWR